MTRQVSGQLLNRAAPYHVPLLSPTLRSAAFPSLSSRCCPACAKVSITLQLSYPATWLQPPAPQFPQPPRHHPASCRAWTRLRACP